MNWSFELAPRRVALLAVLSLALAACKGEKGDPGAVGSEGPAGAAGATGATGPQGPGGNNAATLNTAEAAGANCPTGGVRVDFGLDANGNGVLDPGEVDPLRTSYLCNGPQGAQGLQGAQGSPGTPGANGKNALAATSVEAAGGNCATGGIKVEYGVDADGNGTLDPGEINAALTRYVCNGAQGAQGIQGAQGTPGTNGADGKNSLTATAAEPAGSNCATGGTRVDFGVDANGNGVLDAAEINASLRRFVCNGAQGPQGIQGAQGAAGTLGAYGDGSAGALNVIVNTDWNASPPSANLQFTDINVAAGATLIVPSGTILRATGNATIFGTIIVSPGTSDTGGFRPPPGVAIGPAAQPGAGIGIPRLSAAHLVRLPVYGGGAGARNATCTGGEGGGSFAIFAKGTVSIPGGGSIFANGRDSVNPATGTVGVTGCGGGAGGVVVIIGKASLTVAGVIRANGGNGSGGFDGNLGNAEGGGGGGGGGIIHLLSSTAPAGGTTSTTAGTAGATGGTGATTNSGGGGGACGGNGGAGATTGVASTGGAAGFTLTTTLATPESLLL